MRSARHFPSQFSTDSGRSLDALEAATTIRSAPRAAAVASAQYFGISSAEKFQGNNRGDGSSGIWRSSPASVSEAHRAAERFS